MEFERRNFLKPIAEICFFVQVIKIFISLNDFLTNFRIFAFRNVRKGKISVSKNVPVMVAGRPKNVSASISVVNSNLNETNKKLCGLRSVQLKLKTFTDTDRTESISAASSSKRKPDQIESSKKIKPSKKIDDDSGIVSGENNFFTKNHEPRTIADRKELNFDSLHELSVWHRVAQKNGDENFENSQTMDPVREWNETVDEWRNFGPNCSKSVQNKIQSNTDATESKTLLKYSKPKSSTVYVYAKSKPCVNGDEPHSFDVLSNQAEEPTEGVNIFVNYEFSVDSNILRFMDEIDKKWLPPKKKPKQKLNRLRMDDGKDDEDSVRVVNIF